jgi:DNA-binding IscR family transcriptional regulator
MEWSPAFSERVAHHLVRDGLAQRVDGRAAGLRLTGSGRELAQEVMLR